MKKDILIRFAGDSTYYHRINIDPKKIKDYAQKNLGMKSLKITDFKRISPHA